MQDQVPGYVCSSRNLKACTGLATVTLQLDPFQLQQRHLLIQAAGITGQPAPGADDPVAGNDDGDRIVPHGAAYCPGRHLAGSSWDSGLFSTGSSFRRNLFCTGQTFTAGLWRGRPCRRQFSGNFPIGHHLAVRNLEQPCLYFLAKLCTRWR